MSSEVDAKVLGARIREARERAGLKQGALGEVIGLDRTAINKIESGARKITALELSDAADALGVRMASFFVEPLPALVSHRSNQGLDTSDSKIDHLLANLSAEVEFVHSLAAEELGFDALGTRLGQYPYPMPGSASDAEALAGTARTLIGLQPGEPIGDLVGCVAKIGLLTFTVDLGLDTADAGTILLREGGVSLVNSHNKVGRRRLALAHELGHYLVADEYTVDWRVADEGGDVEARLDRFARALLLPEAGLRPIWSKLIETNELREVAVKVASTFRVDMMTLAKRVRELGLGDADAAAVIRGVSTTQADIIDFGLFVPSDLEGTSLPLPFQKAVLRLFRDERISRERALSLFRGTFDEEDLPPLRVRREDEIWNFVS